MKFIFLEKKLKIKIAVGAFFVHAITFFVVFYVVSKD
jgi:hypothetical protein